DESEGRKVRPHRATTLQHGAVRPAVVQYRAPTFGTGEVWLLDGTVVWSELPVPRRGRPKDAQHPLARRLAAYFAGEPDDFADVALDLDEGFYGDCARALRAVPRGEVVTYGELASLV